MSGIFLKISSNNHNRERKEIILSIWYVCVESNFFSVSMMNTCLDKMGFLNSMWRWRGEFLIFYRVFKEFIKVKVFLIFKDWVIKKFKIKNFEVRILKSIFSCFFLNFFFSNKIPSKTLFLQFHGNLNTCHFKYAENFSINPRSIPSLVKTSKIN